MIHRLAAYKKLFKSMDKYPMTPLLRFLLFFGLCCCYLSIQAEVYAALPTTQNKVPVLTIQAQHLSPQQIGLEIGRQSKLIFPDIERRYDTHLAKTFNQTQFEHILRDRLPQLLTQLDKSYQEEIKGVMGSWSTVNTNKLGDGQLSTDEYFVLNLLPDIGLIPNGSGFGVYGNAAKEGQTFVGRNTDWESTPELRSLQAITVYHYDDKQIVNIGFTGIVSVLTGFNDQGLFLSYLNAEPYSPYTRTYNTTLKSPSNGTSHTDIFEVRKTLETSNTLQQATRHLSAKTFKTANNILMADKKNIQVLEYPANSKARIRRWNSQTQTNKPWEAKQQIAVVDCHVLSSLADNCLESKDTYRWYRLRELAQFSPQHPAQDTDLSNILFDTKNDGNEIFNSQTLNSVIFSPKNNNLYLYTAPIKANKIFQANHQPYLNLLPSSHTLANKRKAPKLSFLLAIWGVVIGMILLVAWIYRLPSKLFKKCKDVLSLLSA